MVNSDWIGQPDPPETSAPLFPEGSRKRHDPRAPGSSGTGGPQHPPPVVVGMATHPVPPPDDLFGDAGPWPECLGMRMVDNPVVLYGTALPSSVVRVYRAPDGLNVGSARADGEGRWVCRVQVAADPGKFCLQVSQSRSGGSTSALSEEFCGWVGPCSTQPPGQVADMESAGLRFSDGGVWRHGSLAVRNGDRWTYGVLRKVGGE